MSFDPNNSKVDSKMRQSYLIFLSTLTILIITPPGSEEKKKRRWSENLILGMEPKFHAYGPKIDEIGGCARILYTTIYYSSRFIDF